MANGYVCARCGQQELVHDVGWSILEECQKAELNSVLSGHSHTFHQCQQLGGYMPSSEEVAAEEQTEAERVAEAQKFNPGWFA